MRAFCTKKYPESTFVKKKIVDIDILITFRSGDIMEPIKRTSGPTKRTSTTVISIDKAG